MNTFRPIRTTASPNQFLHTLKTFTSILNSRFFSNITDGGGGGGGGESGLYHHARLFRKPISSRFRSNLSNSVSLIGFVDLPIRVIGNEQDRFGVSTLLRVNDPRDPNRSFRIPLTMWDVVARRCIAYLKLNDHILVTGLLVSYQVKVTDVNYVKAPPINVLDSRKPEKPEPETEDDIEEYKKDKIYLWQVFFANPYEWWDNRRNKMYPSQPDFKHKDTGETLWIDSGNKPDWVDRQLELMDQREANKSSHRRHDEGQTRRRSGCLGDWI
ncbi:unnamed protein product [Cochlearia groenlandica]